MCETRLFNIKKESGIEPGDEVIFKLLTHAAGTWCRLYVEHLYKVEEYDDISYRAVKQKESVCLLSEEDMKTVLN